MLNLLLPKQENQFFYHFSSIKTSPQLIEEINRSSSFLHSKLAEMDLEEIGLSDYNQRYLKTKIDNPYIHWPINNYLMSTALNAISTPRKEMVLLDYGGGSGTISLLAKKLGVGTVIYCDVYSVSCQDAEKTGEAIGYKADYYVHGEINDVIQLCKSIGLKCNILASHDCIEHIYDIESFLSCIPDLGGDQFIFWLSSAANPLRKKTKITLERVHHQSEYQDRNAAWGQKKSDSLKSYYKLRREIIERNFTSLNKTEINLLAELTRGLKKTDIVKTGVSKNGQNPPIFLTGFLPRQKLFKPLNGGLLSRYSRGRKVGNSLWPI